MPVVGARHYLEKMSPFKPILKSACTAKQGKMLLKALKGQHKAALNQKRQFKVVAGDNMCESRIAATKLQLRRQNRLGRGSPADAHVDQLSAMRLLEAPGLQNLLEACALLRKSRSPKCYMDLSQDKAWLWD